MEDLKVHQTAHILPCFTKELAFQVWWGSEAMQVDVEALPGCEAAEP